MFLEMQQHYRQKAKADVSAMLEDIDNNDKKSYPIKHLNNAGASPSPKIVLQTIFEHFLIWSQFDGHYAAQIQKDAISKIHKSTQRLINSKYDTEIATCESATVAWTRMF